MRLTRIYSLYRVLDDVERVLLEEWLAVLARYLGCSRGGWRPRPRPRKQQ